MGKQTVILIRHAEAEDYFLADDQARMLTARGKIEAIMLGIKLKKTLAEVSTVYISTAVRARETWQGIVTGAALDASILPEITVDQAIYDGTVGEIVEMIRNQSIGKVVVVVGHIPTIAQAAHLFAGPKVQVPQEFSTATAMVLSSSKNWKDWQDDVADQGEVFRGN